MIQETYKKILELVQQGREGEARTLAGENGIEQSYVDLAKEEAAKGRPLPQDPKASKAKIFERIQHVAAGKTPRRRSDDYDQPDFFEMWDAGEQDPLDRLIEETGQEGFLDKQEEDEGPAQEEKRMQLQEDIGPFDMGAEDEKPTEEEQNSEVEGLDSDDSPIIEEDIGPINKDEQEEIKEDIKTIEKIDRRIVELKTSTKELRKKISNMKNQLLSLKEREGNAIKKLEESKPTSKEELERKIVEKYELGTKYYHKIDEKVNQLRDETQNLINALNELSELESVKFDLLPDEEKLNLLNEEKERLEKSIKRLEAKYRKEFRESSNLKIKPSDIDSMLPQELLALLDDKNIYKDQNWQQSAKKEFMKAFEAELVYERTKFYDKLRNLKAKIESQTSDLPKIEQSKILDKMPEVLKRILRIYAYHRAEKKMSDSSETSVQISQKMEKLEKIKKLIDDTVKYKENPQMIEEEYQETIKEKQLEEEELKQLKEEEKRNDEEKKKLYDELEKIKNFNLYKLPAILAEEEEKKKVEEQKKGEAFDFQKNKMNLILKMDEKARELANKIVMKEQKK